MYPQVVFEKTLVSKCSLGFKNFSNLSKQDLTRSLRMAGQHVTAKARVVRASASGAVDVGLIPNRFKPMTSIA